MKLSFNVSNKQQPDPFVFEDKGKYYMYVTADPGVEAYSANGLFEEWKYEGVIHSLDGWRGYWAPCIIKYGKKYYLYFSCEKKGCFEWLHVAVGDSPLGPFTETRCLFERFTIDAHVVGTSQGLFLFYAEEDHNGEHVGTKVFVDKLLDPFTPAGLRKEVVSPTLWEEVFKENRYGDGVNWYCVEGPFWFREGEWQYLMFSGGCYENDSYHIGYAAAKTDNEELTEIDYIKFTQNGQFSPVLMKNKTEEGTGHHSVIKVDGQYYAVYHGRDLKDYVNQGYVEERTARICKLSVKDGRIVAERI